MKIRHIITALSLATVLSIGALASREPFPRFHGEGTKESPFLIESVEDLNLAASLADCGEIFYDWDYVPDYDAGSPSTYYCEACYRLNGDIDCGGQYVEIFGTEETPFYGDFDGAGFAITNVKLRTIESKNGTAAYAGLFGYAVNASIHDLGIENASCQYYGGKEAEAHIGILCGRFENDGAADNVSIERCYVSGGKVMANAPTTTDVYCGGLIGSLHSSSVNAPVTVSDCYAAGVDIKVTGKNIEAGGLIGRADKYPLMISHCYASGCVEASTEVSRTVIGGGIIGRAETTRGSWSPWLSADTVVDSCFADVEIKVKSPLTAIAGNVCGRLMGDSEAGNIFTVRKSINSNEDMHDDGKLVTADKAASLTFWRDTLGMDMTDDWYLPESGYPVLRTNAGISAFINDVSAGKMTVTVGTLSGLDKVEGRLIAALYEGDPEEVPSWKKPFPSFRLTDISMQECTMDGKYARDTYTFTFDDVPAYGHVKVFFVSNDGFTVLAPSAVTELFETDF